MLFTDMLTTQLNAIYFVYIGFLKLYNGGSLFPCPGWNVAAHSFSDYYYCYLIVGNSKLPWFSKWLIKCSVQYIRKCFILRSIILFPSNSSVRAYSGWSPTLSGRGCGWLFSFPYPSLFPLATHISDCSRGSYNLGWKRRKEGKECHWIGLQMTLVSLGPADVESGSSCGYFRGTLEVPSWSHGKFSAGQRLKR